MAVAAAAGPFFGGYQLYVATLGAVYAIVALGNNLLLGHLGVVSLGQGALFGIGAYACGLALRASWPLPVAILVGAGVAAGVGFLVGLPALRLSGHYLALVTLAFAAAVVEIIIVMNPITNGVSGIAVATGVPSPLSTYLLSLGVLTAASLAQEGMLGGRLGRIFHLVRDSERAAAAVGVRIAQYKLLGFSYSGVLAGLGGSLFVLATQYLAPSMFDVFFSVYLLVAVVLGGMNRPFGAIAGSVFIAVLTQVASAFQGLVSITFGLSILIATIAARPSTLQWAREVRSRFGRRRGE
jgi:branched-chain amino acid transport system permease protein